MPLSESVKSALAVVSEEESRLQARRDQLMAQVRDIDDELAVYARITRAVEPPAPKAKAKGGAQPGRPRATPRDQYVSEDAIDRSWTAWREVSEPKSATALGHETPGISHETMRRATEQLRERGYVVAAGRSQNNATLYLPAPDAPSVPPSYIHNGATA